MSEEERKEDEKTIVRGAIERRIGCDRIGNKKRRGEDRTDNKRKQKCELR